MSETNCFHGAEARLHLLDGQPVLILTSPPTEPTPAALARPGEVLVVVHVASGTCWPDRHSRVLATGALAQGGAVALAFASVDDAMACTSRIAHGNRANVPDGVR